MEDKQLQTGYLMAVRDEELLANYSMIKALINKEPHSKEELEKLEKLSVPIQQGEHRHTLPNVRDFLRKHPEFSANLMSHIDPSELVSQIPRAKKIKPVSRLQAAKEKLVNKNDESMPKNEKG